MIVLKAKIWKIYMHADAYFGRVNRKQEKRMLFYNTSNFSCAKITSKSCSLKYANRITDLRTTITNRKY